MSDEWKSRCQASRVGILPPCHSDPAVAGEESSQFPLRVGQVLPIHRRGIRQPTHRNDIPKEVFTHAAKERPVPLRGTRPTARGR